MELQGGLTFIGLMLTKPKLRLVDLCDGITINKVVTEIDKRPSVKQCEPNPTVSNLDIIVF